MVTFSGGHQPRDRHRPGLGHRRADVLQPHPLRRRRGVRHGAAGRHGRGERGGRRRRLLPGLQRALGQPLRRRRAGPAAGARPPRTPTSRGTSPVGLLTPASWVAMFAQRYLHVTGATSEDFGGSRWPTARTPRPTPPAWFYGKPITLEDHQAVALDRRAAAPARLLPGDRRRPGHRRHHAGAGPRPAASPPAVIQAAAQGSGDGQDMMTSYYRDDMTRPARDGRGGPPAVGDLGPRARRHPGGRPLRPLHAARPLPARGVRLLRQGRGEGLRARRPHRARRRRCRSTPTAASSARPTCTA